MNFIIDLFPVIIFFAAFQLYGIQTATVVLILATLLQNIIFWLIHNKYNKMHLFTLTITAIFGTATILLDNPVFIQWKPTVIYIIFGLILLIFPVFAKITVIERVMGKNFNPPASIWKKLNIAWILFFIVMSIVNLYVAFYHNINVIDIDARLSTWVTFKAFGATSIILVFTLLQIPFLMRYIKEKH